MKRMVLLILVFLLMMDLAEDGCLGKAVLCLPHPSTKTSVSSQHLHSAPGHDDSHSELAPSNLPEKPYYEEAGSATLRLPLTLQIIYIAAISAVPAACLCKEPSPCNAFLYHPSIIL